MDRVGAGGASLKLSPGGCEEDKLNEEYEEIPADLVKDNPPQQGQTANVYSKLNPTQQVAKY